MNVDQAVLSEKLKSIQSQDIVVVFSNWRFKDKLLNRIEELKKFNINYILVVSLDTDLNKLLDTKGVTYYYMPLIIRSRKDRGTLWVYRSKIWHAILKLGYNILHMDADAQILKNPFEIIDKSYDINFTQGTSFPMSVFSKWRFVIKCGFFYCTANNKTVDFFNALIPLVIRIKDDQIALNRLIDSRLIKWDIDNNKTYTIKFREQTMLCSLIPIYGKLKGDVNVIVHPHHLVPRVKHRSNTPYVVDYLQP
jgi:hypothetical protein